MGGRIFLSMATFILKTEPGDYSFDDLKRDRKTVWDGVTNPAACKNIRSARKGDEALVYHTGGEKAIVGLARIASDPYHDPKRPETLTGAGEIKFPVFDLAPVKAVKTPVTLGALKADDRFAEFPLVTQGRLSVVPVPARLDRALRRLAGL